MAKIKCEVCGKEFEQITNTHLKKHNMTTDEYRKKFSKTILSSDEYRQKVASFKGKHHTKNACRKISESKKGVSRPDMVGDKNPAKRPEVRVKISAGLKGTPRPHIIGDKNPAKRPEVRKKISKKSRKAMENPEARKNLSNLSIERWKSEEYRARAIPNILKASHKRPTTPEKEIKALLDIFLPNEYKYTGNGEVIVCGKCPDFVNINGKKKIIEVYGDYWHRNDNPQNRIDLFKEYGYDTLVIWEHELENKNQVIDRILHFHDIPSSLCSRRLTLDEKRRK